MIYSPIFVPLAGEFVRFTEAVLFLAPVCYRINAVNDAEVTLAVGDVSLVVPRAMLNEHAQSVDGGVDWKVEEQRFLAHFLATTASVQIG
jgi:hypothetical protein